MLKLPLHAERSARGVPSRKNPINRGANPIGTLINAEASPRCGPHLRVFPQCVALNMTKVD